MENLLKTISEYTEIITLDIAFANAHKEQKKIDFFFLNANQDSFNCMFSTTV